MTPRPVTILAGLALSTTLACGSSQDAAAPPSDVASSSLSRDTSPNVTPDQVRAIARGNNAFGFDVYRRIAHDQGASSNLFFSPYSASVALAMTYAGSAGETATQLAKALHFTLPQAQLHPAFDALDLALASRASVSQPVGPSVPCFQLSVADSVWVDRSQTLRSPFLDTLAVDYGAGVNLVDFARDPDGSRGAINRWVANRTDDKIPDVLPAGAVDSSTRLALVNAVYFFAQWSVPFDASLTTEATFHATGAATRAATMHAQYLLDYAETGDYQAVDIHYLGDAVSMLLVVPKGDVGALETSFGADALGATIASLAPALVTLSVPKFRIDGAAIDLAAALQSLGATDAFVPSKADLSGITGDRTLYVTGVYQQAFVDVDEKGTRAAAATASLGGTTSAVMPTKTVTVNADHPFLFFIRDIPTGAVLFAGRVADPSL